MEELGFGGYRERAVPQSAGNPSPVVPVGISGIASRHRVPGFGFPMGKGNTGLAATWK